MFDSFSLQWPWHPWTMLVLFLLCVLYLTGYSRMRKTGGDVKPGARIAFFGAMLLMVLVLLTPIDTIARTQYLWFHIAQTITITTLCAPLFIYGCDWAITQPLFEIAPVQALLKFLTSPVLASILFNIVFLLWNTPRILNAVVGNSGLYEVMELSIFIFSLCNWYPLIGARPELRRMSYPVQMLYAFLDGQPVDIFAFVLVFTEVPIYAHYQTAVAAHLPAYADQALAGALLLIPGLVDLGVMTPLFFRWLGQTERRTSLADQQHLEEEAEEDDDEWEEEESAEQQASQM